MRLLAKIIAMGALCGTALLSAQGDDTLAERMTLLDAGKYKQEVVTWKRSTEGDPFEQQATVDLESESEFAKLRTMIESRLQSMIETGLAGVIHPQGDNRGVIVVGTMVFRVGEEINFSAAQSDNGSSPQGGKSNAGSGKFFLSEIYPQSVEFRYEDKQSALSRLKAGFLVEVDVPEFFHLRNKESVNAR